MSELIRCPVCKSYSNARVVKSSYSDEFWGECKTCGLESEVTDSVQLAEIAWNEMITQYILSELFCQFFADEKKKPTD